MKWQLYIFAALGLLFLAFSTSIYTRNDISGVSPAAGSGKLVWQKYNCQSCHQLYGLGGYLGPDLTNVLSQDGKGQQYVLAMVRSGVRQMPSFTLTPQEEILLIEFLKQANNSGSADPRDFEVTTTGMIHPR